MAAQTWKNKESVKGYSQTEILQKKKTHIIFLPKFPSDCKKSLLTSKNLYFVILEQRIIILEDLVFSFNLCVSNFLFSMSSGKDLCRIGPRAELFESRSLTNDPGHLRRKSNNG